MSTSRLKSKITENEIKAVQFHLMGYSYRRIGEMLNVNHVRAYVYVQNAKRKLAVNTSNELAEKAIELGIISPEDVDIEGLQ